MIVYKVNHIKNFKKILNIENYVLIALNLAFLAFFFQKKIKLNENNYLWSDGIFAKLFVDSIKIPGSQLLNELNLPKNIKRILVIGNLDYKSKIFLQKRFKIKIDHIKVPKIKEKNLRKFAVSLTKNTLCLITLPTPKQEILSYLIAKKNKFYKIICIGGGLQIASGYIKKCPKILYNLGLEFLWRFRTDPIRRIIRLFKSLCNFMFYFFILRKKLKIRKI